MTRGNVNGANVAAWPLPLPLSGFCLAALCQPPVAVGHRSGGKPQPLAHKGNLQQGVAVRSGGACGAKGVEGDQLKQSGRFLPPWMMISTMYKRKPS